MHTVLWTAHAADIDVVWDAGDGLRLAGDDSGGSASLPWWSAGLGLLVAVGLWRGRSRMGK